MRSPSSLFCCSISCCLCLGIVLIVSFQDFILASATSRARRLTQLTRYTTGHRVHYRSQSTHKSTEYTTGHKVQIRRRRNKKEAKSQFKNYQYLLRKVSSIKAYNLEIWLLVLKIRSEKLASGQKPHPGPIEELKPCSESKKPRQTVGSKKGLR